MNGWISVKDRLPEEEGEYLVTCRWREDDPYRVDTMEYGFRIAPSQEDNPRVFQNGAAFGEMWPNGMDNIEEVIAWMPLPEPYLQEVKADA